jgi:protein arginine N-methyltransferase 1
MSFFIPEYDSLRIHELMLADGVRTMAYQRAIESTVKPGDVVLDIGTGTGALARFAARAGAGRVYAVEPTGMIELARRLAAKDRHAARIEFIRARVEEVTLPAQVDCIVSEWMGVFALQENMLPGIASARRRLLKPGGKMLPEAVHLFLALVEDGPLHDQEIGRWQRHPYGLDYSEFARCQANAVHAAEITSEGLLSDPAEIARLDLHQVCEARLTARTALKAVRRGECHGLAGWFEARFPGGIVLDTAPGQPLTHWHQAFFPALDHVSLEEGAEVAVRLTAEPAGAVVHFAWEAATGEGGNEDGNHAS